MIPSCDWKVTCCTPGLTPTPSTSRNSSFDSFIPFTKIYGRYADLYQIHTHYHKKNILEQYFEENNDAFIHTLQCHRHCP